MKFNLFFTAFLSFITYHFIFCEDWTHSGGNNDEELENEKLKERKETKNLQIGVSLPWVKTSRQHLPNIPKSLLVQINKGMPEDRNIKTAFFCRVEVMKKLKIIGLVRENFC